jgi:uncharacterized surface protein with fasciclin (FAS1) repeats
MANLLETAAKAGSFSKLLAAVEKAGLKETLETPGPYTLLAPTDEAFAKLPEGTLDSLLEDVSKLKRIVAYHVLFGDVRSDDLAQIDEAPTVEGSVVAIEQKGGIKVNGNSVTQMDILTDNGVIHLIDGVLMPAMLVGG